MLKSWRCELSWWKLIILASLKQFHGLCFSLKSKDYLANAYNYVYAAHIAASWFEMGSAFCSVVEFCVTSETVVSAIYPRKFLFVIDIQYSQQGHVAKLPVHCLMHIWVQLFEKGWVGLQTMAMVSTLENLLYLRNLWSCLHYQENFFVGFHIYMYISEDWKFR